SANRHGGSHASLDAVLKNHVSSAQPGGAQTALRNVTFSTRIDPTSTEGSNTAFETRGAKPSRRLAILTPTANSGRSGSFRKRSTPSMESGVPAMMFRAPLSMSHPVAERKPAITEKGT